MSRYNDDGDGPEYPNAGDLWRQSIKLAMQGKRGLQAFKDMRDAILALPEKRLIDRALCTVGLEISESPPERMSWTAEGDHDLYWRTLQATENYELVSEVGHGVCAVGAYVWWKRVKAGEDPQHVFETMPVLADIDSDLWETVTVGSEAGLGVALAWEFAYVNDEKLGGITAEERYVQYLAWLDEQIAQHPLVAA